jgi:hypothetical protein
MDISYQLVISSDSKVWGNTFDISWNFHQDSSDAVYIDGFKNFQVGTTLLSDTQIEPPPGWGTMLSVGPDIQNYQDPWPPGASETPADPADKRYFTVQYSNSIVLSGSFSINHSMD